MISKGKILIIMIQAIDREKKLIEDR